MDRTTGKAGQFPGNPLGQEQLRVVNSFADLRRLLGRGGRRTGAVRVEVLTPTYQHGQLDFGRPLPDRVAEVILYDRSGRIVSVLVGVGGKQVIDTHPLAVRLTVHDAGGQLLARASAPAGNKPDVKTPATKAK